MILYQMLVKMLRREAGVARAVKRFHLVRTVHRNPPAGNLAQFRSADTSAATFAPTPKSSAASNWLNSKAPYRPKMSRNLIIRTPQGLPSGASQPSKKARNLPDRSCATDTTATRGLNRHISRVIVLATHTSGGSNEKACRLSDRSPRGPRRCGHDGHHRRECPVKAQQAGVR